MCMAKGSSWRYSFSQVPPYPTFLLSLSVVLARSHSRLSSPGLYGLKKIEDSDWIEQCNPLFHKGKSHQPSIYRTGILSVTVNTSTHVLRRQRSLRANTSSAIQGSVPAWIASFKLRWWNWFALALGRAFSTAWEVPLNRSLVLNVGLNRIECVWATC